MRVLNSQFNLKKIRNDFPILQTTNRKQALTYLDSAASGQKSLAVVEAISQFYLNDYANIHRGIYELSERASKYYEAARSQIKDFIHAKHADEIIFVKGTTEGINLVAQAFVRSQLKPGDEIIVSELEHHSNIVPWYLLKQQCGININVISLNDDGSLNLENYKNLFNQRTKLVAISHASNALGTITPVKMMTSIAHEYAVPVLVDGAQAIPHMPVDVCELDCDFYAFSAHKLYGPTGIGVLYAKQHHIENMQPYQGGGGMIESVAFDHVAFAKGPQKFEAGTPHIAGVIGFAAAIKYIQSIGMDFIFAHEQSLLNYAEAKLNEISGLRIIGTARPKVGVISFVLDDIHAHDLGTVLDHEGIAIRAGHHCAMPVMQRFNVPATVRASIGIYNNEADIDALVAALKLAKRLFNVA